MPKIAYQRKRFGASTVKVIQRANSILEAYARRAAHIILTPRPLYYQFVARTWRRMAGEIDWEHLQDRTRSLSCLRHWDGPRRHRERSSILSSRTFGPGRPATSKS
jgi:hypothetical protein